MADVTLGIAELRMRPLPPVCMCCGAPATCTKPKTFAWYPKWIGVTVIAGFLIFAILAAVMTKRARVDVPFCEQHKGHFATRTMFGWFGFLGLIALVVLMVMATSGPHHSSALDQLWLLVPVYILAWVVTMIVLGTSTLRPTEITDFYVSITHVSPQFVQAHMALGPAPGMMPAGPYGVPPNYPSPY